MPDRIEIFRQMLSDDPHNAPVMFGLAKEYEKLGKHAEVIELLKDYLTKADDEGNAYSVFSPMPMPSRVIAKPLLKLTKRVSMSQWPTAIHRWQMSIG